MHMAAKKSATKPKHPGGRPTKLNAAMIEAAKAYLDDTEIVGVHTLLPTIEGLALHLGITRETVYDWETKNPEFSDIVGKLRSAQAQKLIQNSLVGRYNPTIAKLILSGKHGYVEKSEVDNNHSGAVQFVNDVPRAKASN